MMAHKAPNKTLRASLPGLLLLVAGTGRAEELDLTLRAGAGYSDNVERTSADERSSGLFAPGLDVNYRETTPHLDATVQGSLDYVNYTASGVDSQLLGDFYGDLAYAFVPENFVWSIDESYGQGRGDLLQPATPQNTEGINYFSTGPRLRLLLSDHMFVTATAQYANSWYQGQNTDSNQYSGGFSLGRLLSQATSVAASVDYQKIDYIDPNAAPNADIWQYYLAYSAKGARTTLKMDAGYRTFDDGSGSQGGPLIRFNLTRQLSAYTSIFILGGDEYNDAASQLNGTLATPGTPGGNNGYSNGQVFVDKYGGGGFSFSRMRTRFGATVTYHDENYLQSGANDVRRWNVNGNIERDLTRAWTAGLKFWYYHEDYTRADYSDAELDYGLYGNWQFARTVGLSIEWDRWQSSASNQPDANENQYWLRLNWHPIHREGRDVPRALIAPPTPGL
jgi:hypothetical protein